MPVLSDILPFNGPSVKLHVELELKPTPSNIFLAPRQVEYILNGVVLMTSFQCDNDGVDEQIGVLESETNSSSSASAMESSGKF